MKKRKKSMGFIELLLLALALSMDAFAVSVCKGLAMRKVSFKGCAICGIWFGSFQALMPMIGYLLGSRFEKYIEAVAPWVAFVLLALIGGNMIREALSKNEEKADAGLDIGFTMIGMHLKKVAVPVRLEQNKIGEALVLAARVRPKFIGGERAQYNAQYL